MFLYHSPSSSQALVSIRTTSKASIIYDGWTQHTQMLISGPWVWTGMLWFPKTLLGIPKHKLLKISSLILERYFRATITLSQSVGQKSEFLRNSNTNNTNVCSAKSDPFGPGALQGTLCGLLHFILTRNPSLCCFSPWGFRTWSNLCKIAQLVFMGRNLNLGLSHF